MRIERIEEFLLKAEERRKISDLLLTCFPGFPTDRIYFKYPPGFRYLVWEGDQLVGHMGVDYRLIGYAGEMIPIFGIMDLCVLPAYQHQRLASKLLTELGGLGEKNAIDFLLLVAKDKALYENNGFFSGSNTCQWLLMVGNQALGMVKRKLPELMVKPLGKKAWPEGLIDFMGPLF